VKKDNNAKVAGKRQQWKNGGKKYAKVAGKRQQCTPDNKRDYSHG
jgi:hypothetical protein